MRRLPAILGAVDLAHTQRIDLQRVREFVDAAFDAERADRRTRRAVGGNLGPVGQDVIADRQRIRKVVDRHPTDAALLHRRAGERAGLVFENALRGGDVAVLLRADLDFDDGAGSGPGGAEHLLAAHHHLDRPARFFRQHVGERFEIDDRLAAEPAADLGRDRADIGDIGTAEARGVGADHELALARAEDRRLAVGADRNQARMRLNIALVHRFCRIAPLDDEIGFLEAGLDVAFREGDHLGDIRRLRRLRLDPGGEDVVMQDRCALRHRRLDIHHIGQHFVLHLDQVERLFGDRRRGCRHGGHRVALVEHLAPGHAVARQVAQIVRHGADMGALRRYVGEIGAGDDRLDPRQRRRLCGIDPDDAGMGVRAALDAAPQHARHHHVGAEIGPAGDLVDAVRTDRPGADDLEARLVEITHRATPPRLGIQRPSRRALRALLRMRISLWWH